MRNLSISRIDLELLSWLLTNISYVDEYFKKEYSVSFSIPSKTENVSFYNVAFDGDVENSMCEIHIDGSILVYDLYQKVITVEDFLSTLKMLKRTKKINSVIDG